MEIDHIIPVHKAETTARARFFLKILGIKDVNDPRNLCASCRRCNRKKGAKMGLWVIRGKLGKYKVYWVLRYTLIAVILVVIVGAVIAEIIFHMPIVETIINWLTAQWQRFTLWFTSLLY